MMNMLMMPNSRLFYLQKTSCVRKVPMLGNVEFMEWLELIEWLTQFDKKEFLSAIRTCTRPLEYDVQSMIL